jgi:4,5:9,10-diseco-3-hydroxy-5,9,17-trioxoandrosta-1(10),2-diene-4-oate hydrolase
VNAPEDRYIDVNGIRTRYWDEGDKAAPPVVLVHGIGASVEAWTPTLPALVPDHRVVALDLVGYGYTDKPRDAPYTFSYLADFVRQVMDRLEIPETVLMGHSLGGGVAVKLAEMAPSRIRRLVAVDAAGLGTEGLSVVYQLMVIPGVGRWLTRTEPSWVRRFLEGLFHDPEHVTDEMVELNVEMMSQPGARAAYLSTIRSIATVFGPREDVVADIVDHLDAITAETLVIWGQQDEAIPLAHGETAVESIPDAELVVLEACGHMPMVEQRGAFNEIVREFLAPA